MRLNFGFLINIPVKLILLYLVIDHYLNIGWWHWNPQINLPRFPVVIGLSILVLLLAPVFMRLVSLFFRLLFYLGLEIEFHVSLWPITIAGCGFFFVMCLASGAFALFVLGLFGLVSTVPPSVISLIWVALVVGALQHFKLADLGYTD